MYGSEFFRRIGGGAKRARDTWRDLEIRTILPTCRVHMGGALVGREWTFEVETQVPLEQIKDHCTRNHVQACTAYVYEPSCKGYSHQPKVFEGRWDGVRISLIEVSASAASGGAYRYE